MIFKVDKDKVITTIYREDNAEKYKCLFNACNNPVCCCYTINLNLSPLQNENQDQSSLSSYEFGINIFDRELGDESKEEISKDDLAFANFFISKLSDEDFEFLHEKYFVYKNIITEEASWDSIEATFEYKDVEDGGLMYSYNEVLPFGNRLMVTIDGKERIIDDYYCLTPRCSCSDVILNIMQAEKFNVAESKQLCSLLVTYTENRWSLYDKAPYPISLKTARKSLEEQIPNFYEELFNRHIKLKSIYAYCKKRDYSHRQPLQAQKVGRNEPCPCGSGKKYKKCCMEKEAS